MVLDLHLPDHRRRRGLFKDYSAVHELAIQFLKKAKVAFTKEGRERLLELRVGVV